MATSMELPPPRPITAWTFRSRAIAAAESVVSTDGSGSTPVKTDTSSPAALTLPAIRSARPIRSMVSSVTIRTLLAPEAFTSSPAFDDTPGPKWTRPAMNMLKSTCDHSLTFNMPLMRSHERAAAPPSPSTYPLPLMPLPVFPERSCSHSFASSDADLTTAAAPSEISASE